MKRNAEVTSPHLLKEEMLDIVPEEFWTTPKKVFEPSAGKGGFLINVYIRFFKGLS